MHDTNSSKHSNEQQFKYTSIKSRKSTVLRKLTETKISKSSGIIWKYITQNKWYRFSHAAYEYLHDEPLTLMFAVISDSIYIDVSSILYIHQNTSYGSLILSYLVQHHMNQSISQSICQLILVTIIIYQFIKCSVYDSDVLFNLLYS